MAKAVAKSKKIAAKSKPSAKPAATARKPLKKAAAKVAAKAPHRPAAAAAPKAGKWVYTFGDGKAGARPDMRDPGGGKGATPAERPNPALPVPPGFTIPT